VDNFWTQRFRELVGWDVMVVSTIDHPYPSLPVHLFDGHLRLNRKYGDSVLIMNWDVSHPLDRFYRYDLTTDCGFIGKNTKLYHYRLHTAYADQFLDPEPWATLRHAIPVAGQALQRKHHLSDSFTADLVTRALHFVSAVKALYHENMPAWKYTADQLTLCYDRLLQPRLQRFIATQYCNYWLSKFTSQWIPLCLRDVQGPLEFSRLQAAGLFKRIPFRVRAPEADEVITAGNLNDIALAIESGQVIPSLDVFYWSLAVAGVQHYGNDFDFFQRIAEITGNPQLSALQCTKDEEDCTRFLKFDADYGVLLDIGGDEIRPSNRPANQSKLTRVTTLGSVMIAMGQDAIDLLEKYAQSKYQRATLSLEKNYCAVRTQID
jgi:hypothetical protein